jgi:two-component system sensor histidine kinase KdpD
LPRRLLQQTTWFGRLNGLQRYGFALVMVAGASAGAFTLDRLTGSDRVGGVFSGATLVTAYLVGSGPGYLAALLSFLVYNVFVGRLNSSLGDYTVEDILVLTSFLMVAMLMGNLTGRLRDEAKRAEARARTTAVLFEATREFSATDDGQMIRTRLAEHLAEAAHGRAFVLRDEQLSSSGEEPPAMVLSAARTLIEAAGELGDTVEAADWTLRPLSGGGVAGWTADPRPDQDGEALLQILADAGAAAIARAQLAVAKAEAEARARTEDLRNALLSSISHDLRTPLAAVLASATSLQEFGDRFDAGTRRDLTNTIQEEAERLNAFVTNLLNMTRLEGGALDARSTPFDLAEVIDRTCRRFERTGAGRTISCELNDGALTAVGDPVLFEVALGNVLENAVRYSPDGAVISLVSARRDGQVVVAVSDQGPGVAPGELSKLFDKFFRGSGAKRLPGTGLGLSIVRGVMQGMGGSAVAEVRRDGASGLVVSLALPAEVV